jgi:hypothetical protein
MAMILFGNQKPGIFAAVSIIERVSCATATDAFEQFVEKFWHLP